MVESKAFHEDFGRVDEPKAGGERGFGMVFAFVFAVIGLWPLWDGDGIRLWALIAACVFAAAGLFTPALLRPLNRVWFLFGMALHKVVNPVVMGLLFYAAIMTKIGSSQNFLRTFGNIQSSAKKSIAVP